MATALRGRKRSVDDLPTRLVDPDCEFERRELIALGERIIAKVPKAWPRFQKWLNAIHGLNDEACRTFSPEAALATLAAVLRRLWLQVAHESSDPYTRSPQRDAQTTLPSGEEIDFGYERDIEPRQLERRCASYAPAPDGWSGDHVLFSCAQSGLTAILHWAMRHRFWHGSNSPQATFAGGYFETLDLFDLFARDGLRWKNAKALSGETIGNAGSSSLIVIEPVFFDADGVNVFDIKAFHDNWARLEASEPALMVIDTTLTGPLFPLDEFLGPLAGPCAPTVIVVRSGLKLDQAGLELANAGIVSIFSEAASALPARDIAQDLRKIRTIIGGGLTFDEIAALEAPWFLDAEYFRRYSEAVFANNAALADALKSRRGLLFDRICHPRYARPDCAWAQAPYCTLHMAEGGPEHYRFIEKVVAYEAARRGLLFELGGSFGFRGHRFEAVIPAPSRGAPFLRVAMGARGGYSAHGAMHLVRDIATFENFGQLAARYKNVALT
jgi:hypothetical protein